MSEVSRVTFDNILRFGLMVQKVHGTTIRFETGQRGTHLETMTLPNDLDLIRLFQRLRNEALLTRLEDAAIKPSIYFHVPGIDIRVDSANDDQGDGVSFGIAVPPSSDILEDAKKLDKKNEVEEYRVYDDYQTTFVWAVINGMQHMVGQNPSLSTTFTPSLAKYIESWSEVFDRNFQLTLGEQGGGRLGVFSTIEEAGVWTLEGAMLAISMAAVTSTPVLYSGYLNESIKYRFVGDSFKDAATLLDLTLRVVGA